MKKNDMIEELWMDWDYVINEYLDTFRDVFFKEMNKKNKNEIKKILEENKDEGFRYSIREYESLHN